MAEAKKTPGKPWAVGRPTHCCETFVKEKQLFKDHNELFHRRQQEQDKGIEYIIIWLRANMI